MRGGGKCVLICVRVCEGEGLKECCQAAIWTNKHAFHQFALNYKKVLIRYCNTHQGGFDVWKKEPEDDDCDDG